MGAGYTPHVGSDFSGVCSQFRQYNSHYTELERRLGKIVSEETVIPVYRWVKKNHLL